MRPEAIAMEVVVAAGRKHVTKVQAAALEVAIFQAEIEVARNGVTNAGDQLPGEARITSAIDIASRGGECRSAIDGSASESLFIRRPTSPQEWKERAALIRQSLVSADWLDILSPAFDAKGKAAERLERAAKSGIAVTAGQQPGLFGGPLYTWWKYDGRCRL